MTKWETENVTDWVFDSHSIYSEQFFKVLDRNERSIYCRNDFVGIRNISATSM